MLLIYLLTNNFHSFLILQAQASLAASSKKLDLLRFSLERRRQELPPDSPASVQLKKELQSVQASSPGSISYTSLQPFRPADSRQNNAPSHASFSRCASVTGKLEASSNSL